VTRRLPPPGWRYSSCAASARRGTDCRRRRVRRSSAYAGGGQDVSVRSFDYCEWYWALAFSRTEHGSRLHCESQHRTGPEGQTLVRAREARRRRTVRATGGRKWGRLEPATRDAHAEQLTLFLTLRGDAGTAGGTTWREGLRSLEWVAVRCADDHAGCLCSPLVSAATQHSKARQHRETLRGSVSIA